MPNGRLELQFSFSGLLSTNSHDLSASHFPQQNGPAVESGLTLHRTDKIKKYPPTIIKPKNTKHKHGGKEPKQEARSKQRCPINLKPSTSDSARAESLTTKLQAQLPPASEGAARGAGPLSVWISRLVLQSRKEGRGPRRPAPTRRPAARPWGSVRASGGAELAWGRAGQQRCGRLGCPAPAYLRSLLPAPNALAGRTLQRPGPLPCSRPHPEKPGQRPGLRPARGRLGSRASSQPLSETGARFPRHLLLLPCPSARSSAHALCEGRG